MLPRAASPRRDIVCETCPESFATVKNTPVAFPTSFAPKAKAEKQSAKSRIALATWSGCRVNGNHATIIWYRTAAKSAVAMGEEIQAIPMPPMTPHFTPAAPYAYRPYPRTLPTIEWVVEMGSPFHVHKVIQRHAERTVVTDPSRFNSWTTPIPIVFMTMNPCVRAPSAAKKQKRRRAPRRVITPEPTAHSVGFDASFAPRHQAR